MEGIIQPRDNRRRKMVEKAFSASCFYCCVAYIYAVRCSLHFDTLFYL